MDLQLVDVIPEKQVDLSVRGDVDGTAVVQFTRAGSDTRIDVEWRVATTLPWMNLAAPVLRPVFTWGHRVVMRGGEEGLNRILATRPAGT